MSADDNINSLRCKFHAYHKSVADATDKEARANPEATTVLIQDIIYGLKSEADKGCSVYLWKPAGIPPKRVEHVLYILRKDYHYLMVVAHAGGKLYSISFSPNEHRYSTRG